MGASRPTMVVHETSPYNAGPPPEQLADSLITPTERFFVRSHAEPPQVAAASYRLRVGGMVGRPALLSLEDLRALPRARVTATLQCAGNRRDELLALGPIPGELPWGGGAVGTAVWEGVRLADVLTAAGVQPGARHVAFEGIDEVRRGGAARPFGGSIPLEAALSPAVLLADTMNGAPLTPEHGWPLRAVAPGAIGARSVKWLAAVSVQAEPSDSYFQQQAYRLTRDPAAPGEMLDDLFVTALICEPAPAAVAPAGELRVAGYALTGRAAYVLRVEVSADGGATWREAALRGPASPGVWRLWEARLALGPGEHELVVRAEDSAGRSMPATLAEAWNVKGYMNNSWHRRRVVVR